MLPPTIKGKARPKGEEMKGGRKRLSEIEIFFFFYRKRRRPRMAYGASYLKGTRFFDRGGMIVGLSPRSARWPIGIAAFGLCLPFIIKNSGSARESAGNNRKEGVHVAAAPAPPLSQWGSRFGIYYKRENPLQITTPLLGQRVEWPRADLFGYIIQVESRVTGTAV